MAHQSTDVRLDGISEEKHFDDTIAAPAPSYGSGELEATHSIKEDSDEREPTPEELATLRRIGDKIPYTAWLVAVVELAERFTYYGLTGPWQNYMQNPLHDPLRPGALGLGQSTASSLQYFFQFWCYVTPIFGAIVADAWVGRYNAICIFSVIYVAGLVILFATSVPSSLEHGAGFGGIIVTMIVLGLGTGGIKSNVSPLIAEQYTKAKPFVRTLKSGERVIVDPTITIQSLYNIFYWCINIGSLSAIATVWMELKIGFWAAFLLPFCFFFLAIAVLVIGKGKYVVRPPKGSVLLDAGKAMAIAARHKFNMDAAIPQFGEQFVLELKRALVACRVFCFFPVFWLLYGQMNTNFVSMAGTMQTHGLPNDLLFNLDPITIIIFIPIVEKFLYPTLRKHGIPFRPITRITFGFFLVAGSMAYAAGIQKYVYSQGPCYDFPLECPASDNGAIPNRAHIALQTPAYFLIGIGEIFASITGLEYAFTKAPPSMKSLVTAIFLLQTAFGSAIGIGVVQTATHPHMVTFYACLAGITFLAGSAFFFCFRHLNETEEEMNKLDAENEEFRVRPESEITTVLGKVKEKVVHSDHV
ncbi:POT family-domain-containing protein [Sphaerosporella brunnea]|uniref:POT family-domain-containing protein n=1 Tax=Sphaerosporella brunnea TaxID=1250544 RepID=A0A5J5EHH3_9PEZI|nr:POT family-domain-containing protein [Sphaerosporella brunnea]